MMVIIANRDSIINIISSFRVNVSYLNFVTTSFSTNTAVTTTPKEHLNLI